MKQYNNEKAIISLTSWKKRIDNVWKTLYSIIKNCPGFHIVLTLAEEEFPNKEKDLPKSLTDLIDNDIIEILWVEKNYKSLKKILFTMNKYPDVPIISADDDCIYICNYAEELYDEWLLNKDKFITVNIIQPWWTRGPHTLYYPHCFGDDYLDFLKQNKHLDKYMYADDAFYETLRFRLYKDEHKIVYLKPHKVYVTGDEIEPMWHTYTKPGFSNEIKKIQSEELGFDVNYIFNQK